MKPFRFYPNSLSDDGFETYLKDIHRQIDYLDVRDRLLPKVFDSIEEFSKGVHARFSCVNRFEGKFPALRIQAPAGFVPDVIYIEFLPRHESFRVKQAEQEVDIQGFENLENRLRVILTMGIAHWQPM